tara:strand:- start:718 stop:1077 length:360 start_codon:yes stop_codon:yes gene_type:complete
MKARDYYEVKLYLGSINGVTGENIYASKLERVVGEIQEEYGKIIPVRITQTTYISGINYRETGWEIAAINYPRLFIPMSDIKEFMLELGNKLLKNFGQSRICVLDSVENEIIMLERENG